jgi:fucose permease
MKQFKYHHTLAACYLAYITQAVINNLCPLLFLTFQRQFQISLNSLALLVTMNFCLQLGVDLFATKFIDRIGYRTAAVSANFFCVIGLVSLGILPFIMPDPYLGIILAIIINSIGGGLIEVIISPIVEALPGNRKAAAMSLLHSFYCWGHVLVIVLSTFYFIGIGIEHWRFLPMLWAFLPLGNILLFSQVPLKTLIDESKSQVPLRRLLSTRVFIILFLLMICSGASEQAMSQWASLFAEAGLKVSKTMGDLLGPCSFAILMGISRVFFGLQSGSIKIERVLLISGLLCIISYFLAVFSPHALISLAGCALCGLSVGILWPGTFSMASKIFPLGGTAMFAILALAGDVGCAGGPGLVGMIMNETTLRGGLFVAVVFPVSLVVCICFVLRWKDSFQDLPR